jgi:hypothetical protein
MIIFLIKKKMLKKFPLCVFVVKNKIDSYKEPRQELADMAGVSHTTLDKVEYISEHADEETKSKLHRGEKGTSINKEYQCLKAESKEPSKTSRKSKPAPSAAPSDSPTTATPVTLKSRSPLNNIYCCGIQHEPDQGDTEYDWLTEEEKKEFANMPKECVNPTFPKICNFTIQNIPEHKPDALIDCLYSLFKVRYREKLVYALLREMYKKEGEEEDLARHIVNTLYVVLQSINVALQLAILAGFLYLVNS